MFYVMQPVYTIKDGMDELSRLFLLVRNSCVDWGLGFIRSGYFGEP